MLSFFVKNAPDILQLLENKENSATSSDYYISPSSDTFEFILNQHSILKEHIDLYVSSFSIQDVG
jgi:hypothetical protein